MRGASIEGLNAAPRGSALGAVAWAIYAGAIYLFLYAPLLCLAVLSFNDTPNITLPWAGFTGRWYAEVFANRELHEALRNSILLAVVTVAIAVPTGVLAVYAFRNRFRARGLLFNLVLLALVAPPIIVGVAQNIFWNALGFSASLLGTTLVGHVTYTVPFVFVIVYPSFHRLNRELEEAARDLGASRPLMFRTVILPLVKPGVIAATVFAFMLSFDEFIRTFFLIGADNTLPIYLWSMMLTNVSPQTNAIATLMILFSLALMYLGHVLIRQSHR